MSSLAMMGLIFFAGILVTFVMAFAHTWFGVLHGKFIADEPWWMRGALAGFGLSIIYLLGGSLIEFTGNESIKPFIAQSASLGVLGVLWIIATKIMAISWSKTMGYRGGMIFPSVFVASGLVILATMAVSDLNFIYGLIFAMAGIMVGNSKTRVLA